MAGPSRWRICGQTPSTATPPARKRFREGLTGKIGLQIASVYAGLNGDKSALCGHPTAPMNMSLKSPALAFSQFGYGDGRTPILAGGQQNCLPQATEPQRRDSRRLESWAGCPGYLERRCRGHAHVFGHVRSNRLDRWRGISAPRRWMTVGKSRGFQTSGLTANAMQRQVAQNHRLVHLAIGRPAMQDMGSRRG